MKEKRSLPRWCVGPVILIVLIGILVLGLYLYNLFFRFEFEMIFIGVPAYRVFDHGVHVDITLDPGQYVGDHLFTLPWQK